MLQLYKSIAKGSATEPYLGGSGRAYPRLLCMAAPRRRHHTRVAWMERGRHRRAKGTPIYAAANGTVIVAKDNGAWNGGYGNYVVISHPNGTETLYAHMSKVLTCAGASVCQGDTIGLVGMTGEATGNHLHFEVRGAANPFAN